MCLDIKDHFLATPMDNQELMRVKYKYTQEDIKAKYYIDRMVANDRWVYVKIQKGMPGFRQADILACKNLKNSLEPYGYAPIPRTIGLWQHNKRLTKFCLCIHDFGINNWSKADADHLCNAMVVNFRYNFDKEGSNYCGLNLKCNYNLRYMDTSMHKYVVKTLQLLNHKINKSPQYSLHTCNPIIFSRKGIQQMVENEQHKDLPQNKIRHTQSIADSFLCYARAMDFIMLTALNDIGTAQEKPTEYANHE